MVVKLNIPLLLLFLLLSLFGKSQNSDSISTVLLQPSINEIIKLRPDIATETKVTIANLTETNIYEAPNVITIITDEDIANLGLRDLLDVLNTIPGIQIANDVQNGTSIGMRGMWAEEGKVLFMMDGLVMNDMSYGSIILGHRFSLINIKRIEVIRGAGSSIYGGLAALGVINIVTKSGQEVNGHSISLAGGLSNNELSRILANYYYGGALIKGIDLTTCATINAGKRSNEQRMLPDSSVANFQDSSLVNSIQLLCRLKYKKFTLKQLYEDYNFEASYEPIFSLTRTSITNLSYNFKFRKLDITPFFDYKWQLPWNTQYGDPLIYDLQNLITRRQTLGVNGSYKPLRWLNIIFGSQYYNDNYKHHRKSLTLNNGMYSQSYDAYIVFAEATISTKIAIINIGGRFDQYAYFKPNVLPRLSLAKSFKKWHYKILYGQSFKIPSLQNINLDFSNSLVPEKVTDVQGELGFHSKFLDITATVFNNTLNKLIVYGYDANFNESYSNSGSVKSQGLEMESKIKYKQFILKANYSTFDIISSSAKEILVDTLNLHKGTLAFSRHKLVTNFTYKINQKNSLSLSYIFQTKKAAVERVDIANDEYALISYPSTNNINITYQRTGLFHKVLDVNIGVFNILNTRNFYAYPYNEGYSPLLGMGRELFINLKFNL
jgi:outer membrane cobalamin receptor